MVSGQVNVVVLYGFCGSCCVSRCLWHLATAPAGDHFSGSNMMLFVAL